MLGLLINLVILITYIFAHSNVEACPPSLGKSEVDISSIEEPSPSTGEQKVLVILVDFSDEQGKYTQKSFYDQFFGSNSTGSFADYFRENSYGELRYSGDVVGIHLTSSQKNLAAPIYVRMPNPKSYYANNNFGNDPNAFPRSVAGVFRDAVALLDQVGFDFTPYADQNKIVRNAIVIAAGHTGSETRNANDLNAQHYTLDYGSGMPGGYITSNGVILKTFSICPEQERNEQASIGICTHEQGHALGLPDLYDLYIPLVLQDFLT